MLVTERPDQLDDPQRRRRVRMQFGQWLRRRSLPHRSLRERGDVPGWVMITVMTAGLVAVLWQFTGPYLQGVLKAALDQTVGVG